MKSLYTLLVILTVGIASAQESELTISQITHGDYTYTHIKGEDNGAETCFTADSQSIISMSVNGLAVSTVSIDDATYSWTGPGAEALAISFGSWDDYNRFYRNRGTQRPVRVADDLISCDGWIRGNDGQTYSNSAFDGYTYNSFDIDPGVNHGNNLGAFVYHNGVRISFGGVANSRENLETAINAAINLHMNPVEIPETVTETPTTAASGWVEGPAQVWHTGGRDTFTNSDYPGYQYYIVGPIDIGPNAGKYQVHVGFDDEYGMFSFSAWIAVDRIGIDNIYYDSEQEAINAARAFIHTRGVDNLEIARGERYVISQFGTAYYVEITTQHGVLVIFRAFLDRDEAIAFATDPSSYPSPTSFTAADFNTETHANPGWRRGVYQGGLAGYTVTAPTRFSSNIQATWTWTDNRGVGHSGSDTFTVESSLEYVPLWLTVDQINASGDRYKYPSIEAAINDNPGRTASDFYNQLAYTQLQIDTAQDAAVAWAISAINDFIVQHPSN